MNEFKKDMVATRTSDVMQLDTIKNSVCTPLARAKMQMKPHASKCCM
jgi:hypothetical protein